MTLFGRQGGVLGCLWDEASNNLGYIRVSTGTARVTNDFFRRVLKNSEDIYWLLFRR